MNLFRYLVTRTMNVHLLQHLPELVERSGTVWAYSCFWYESLNGILKRFVHGTRYVDSQVWKHNRKLFHCENA